MKIFSLAFLSILTGLICLWGIIYSDALIAMEGTWRRSDTFAHGYFILPISLWLIWRDKQYVLSSYSQPSWLALPVLAGSLFTGVFSLAADINVLGQLSAIASLICLVWLLMGDHLAWRYKFPLAYLLFLVPMGENLIPLLQDVTAWFTVTFLQIHGIPVFRDGLYIQVPTGLFEVAVACSGIRYLIASVAIGTLYAYLSYRKLYKQLIFILFSAFLPIIANGIRAYGIVIIAYYSDMKYATGVDHLIYGWLFFGLVMMLMFYVGGKFSDTEQPSVSNSSAVANTLKGNRYALIFAGSFLVMAIYAVVNLQVVEKPSEPTEALSLSDTTISTNSSWGITFSDGLQRSHLKMDNGVELFKAVYANKQSEGEMISFNNKLYDLENWTVIASKTINVKSNTAKVVHLRDINSINRSIIYYYKSGEYFSTSKVEIKVIQALNMLFGLSEKSEVVAVSLVSDKPVEQVEKTLVELLLTIDSEGH